MPLVHLSHLHVRVRNLPAASVQRALDALPAALARELSGRGWGGRSNAGAVADAAGAAPGSAPDRSGPVRFAEAPSVQALSAALARRVAAALAARAGGGAA